MNPLESQLDYPLRRDPARAPARRIEVAPGVRWLRMGLPFALDHINLWLLRDEVARRRRRRQGWTIVDCGIDDPATRAAWEQHLRDRARRPAGAARHRHPHAPRPHRLRALAVRALERARCGSAPPTSTSPAWRAAPAPASAGRSRPPSWRSTAWPPTPTPSTRSRARTNYYRSLVPARAAQLPAPARRRQRRDRQRRAAQPLDAATPATATRPSTWRCTAPTHGVLISGDMVLPRISTNVSVIDVEPEADPLTLYLDSIERMRAICPPTCWCCPRTAGRSAACTRASTSCRRTTTSASPTCWRPAPRRRRARSSSCRCSSSRPLDLHQMTFAMGESIAHLHALWFARQAGAPARRRRRLPLRARRLRRPEISAPRAARSGPRWRS